LFDLLGVDNAMK